MELQSDERGRERFQEGALVSEIRTAMKVIMISLLEDFKTHPKKLSGSSSTTGRWVGG